MAIQRMDHVSVVVDDLEAAIAFFVELGMELEGEAPIEGRWVDRVVGRRAGLTHRTPLPCSLPGQPPNNSARRGTD
jgi:catechol 2,3-dioxygenase-like lactoylglutathione lyase family enzyme